MEKQRIQARSSSDNEQMDVHETVPQKLFFVAVCVFALSCVGATCSLDEMRYALSEGTDYRWDAQDSSVDYVLVLDRSGSMRGEKLSQAKDAANHLVSQLRRGDRAAVIAFDTEPLLISAFSNDAELLSSRIDGIEAGTFTRYSQSLLDARSLFDGNRRVIILLSDGRPDDDRALLYDSVQDVVEDDVCLFTIAYATSEDVEAQRLLRSIAEQSNNFSGCGAFFEAESNAFDLRYVFEQIYTSVSSDELLDVGVDVETNGVASLSVRVRSLLNDQDLSGLACFTPRFKYLLVRNKEIVYEQMSSQETVSVELPAGQYEYFVGVEETCGGACYFTGRANGTFWMDPGLSACDTVWDELSSMLTSQEYVEVHITKDGFVPQTVGTDGVVTWKNLDSVSHRVVAADGSFMSPVLRPGESWSKAFSPGVYTYGDADASLSGMFKNDAVPAHTPVDLVLVLDRSGSMTGDPLVSAKVAALNLISILSPSDRASLVVFSDHASLVQSLTSDPGLLRDAVESVRSEGSTFYVEPLRVAGSEIARSSARRSQLVLFLSDGAPYDAGGEDAILRVVDEELSGACLYTIGYGDQGVDAIELLRAMARRVDETTGCGEFYFSTANKQELSEVFGEIYALTQDPGLEVYDIEVPERPGDSFVLSARVRSLANGVGVPSTTLAGCIPPAEVFAVFGGQRFSLRYQDGRYVGIVNLPPGEHVGEVMARVSAPDQPALVVVGSTRVTVRVEGTNWLLWSFVAVGLFFLAIYVFKPRRSARAHGVRED